MPPRLLDLKLRQRPSVALAVPSAEYIHRQAFMSIMQMVAYGFKPGDECLTMPKLATIALARNMIIEAFLALPEQVQFLIMLDSDMVPPVNLIDIFVGRPDYRFPFLSAYCSRKSYPYMPVTARHTGMTERYGEQVHVYKPIVNIEVDSGIHKVDGIGAAALCLRRDLLEAIDPPWFAFEAGGEDYYFCRKVQAVTLPDAPEGVWIAVDSHTEVGHAGESVSYPRNWFSVKDEYLRLYGEDELDLEIEAPALVSA